MTADGGYIATRDADVTITLFNFLLTILTPNIGPYARSLQVSQLADLLTIAYATLLSYRLSFTSY